MHATPRGPAEAKTALIQVLQNAYSGELAASLAYGGHARSVNSPVEKKEIEKILDEELVHREDVGKMLAVLGASPDPTKERKSFWIGTLISLLCRIGGWFVPMWGAGKLESTNIVEYEDAAYYANLAGYVQFVEKLLTMAEVEWDHELYFRTKAETSFLRHIFPRWPVPPPREEIRNKSTKW